MIFTGGVGGILVLGLSFAFYAGAYAFLSQGRLEWMPLLFWGIFLFWQIFPIFVAGFGASFEFRTLLRFPLSRGAFYIIGLAYGLADFAAIASVCWLISMTLGATVANPRVLLLMLLIVAVFSVFLWSGFAAQSRGEEFNETAAPAAVAVRSTARKEDAPDRLSALSPQVAAVLRKEFRYLTRNTFTSFTLLMPPILVLIFSSQFAGRHPTVSGQPVSAEMFFPGMMAYLILILMAPAYNCFAYEGRGMQTYFMVPLRFREVFLGKNLMLALVLAVEVSLSLVMLAWRVGLPSPPMLVGTLAAIVFTVVGQLVIANWSSVNFPRKLKFGKLRGHRQSGMACLIAFAAQLLLGGISAVILFSGRWTGNPWLHTEALGCLAAAAVGGYFASLYHLTRLAEAKKEVLLEALCPRFISRRGTSQSPTRPSRISTPSAPPHPLSP